MRIAMMTNNYKPVIGGVPVSVERLSRSLRERGHAVTVFAPHCKGETEERGVVRFRSLDRDLPAGVVIPDFLDPVIEEAFVRGEYDLIHLHHPMMAGYAGLHLGRKYGVPVAFTYHTRYEQYLHHAGPYRLLQRHAPPLCAPVRGAVRAHNRAFMNRCDLVFAPTPLIRDHLGELGVRTPIEILPTGLGEEDFAYSEERAAALRGRYLAGRRYLFCTVARLEEEKNLSFLLRAMARYRGMRGDCFRLLLIGDGTKRQALEQEAAALGLADNAVFTGSVPHAELADYYRASDLFVFASKSETQGLVLLEGMAAGLPVVAVDASGVCDVVADGYNGWKTLEDETSFAAHAGLAVEDPAARVRMGAAASLTALRCTADHTARRAEALYQHILQRRSMPAAGDGCGRVQTGGKYDMIQAVATALAILVVLPWWNYTGC